MANSGTRTIDLDRLFVREILFKDLGNAPISSGKVLTTRGDGGIFFQDAGSSLNISSGSVNTSSLGVGSNVFSDLDFLSTNTGNCACLDLLSCGTASTLNNYLIIADNYTSTSVAFQKEYLYSESVSDGVTLTAQGHEFAMGFYHQLSTGDSYKATPATFAPIFQQIEVLKQASSAIISTQIYIQQNVAYLDKICAPQDLSINADNVITSSIVSNNISTVYIEFDYGYGNALGISSINLSSINGKPYVAANSTFSTVYVSSLFVNVIQGNVGVFSSLYASSFNIQTIISEAVTTAIVTSSLLAEVAYISDLTVSTLHGVWAELSCLTVSSIQGNNGSFSTFEIQSASISSLQVSSLVNDVAAISDITVSTLHGGWAELSCLTVSSIQGNSGSFSSFAIHSASISSLQVSTLVNDVASISDLTVSTLHGGWAELSCITVSSIQGDSGSFSTFTIDTASISSLSVITFSVINADISNASFSTLYGNWAELSCITVSSIQGNGAKFSTVVTNTASISSLTVSSISGLNLDYFPHLSISSLQVSSLVNNVAAISDLTISTLYGG